jgi:hypothetical protein
VSATFQIMGLRELMAELRKLPAVLAAAGGERVEEHTRDAANDVIAQYPEVTGNLKGGVKYSMKRSRDGATGRIGTYAPHAFIYETGTASRQTDLGYNRGPMPGKKIFVPTVQKHRAALQDDLADILREAGMEVREVHGVGPL